MKVSNHTSVPVYTISGSSTARPLPEWLARKRKRSLKQDPEYASRVELLQDFEFEEASSCVRVSEDGNWIMSTGTYKPQIHTHYLPHLSLSFARHTDALNQTFTLLSSDYTKSIHLQSDRFVEFHTPQGCHYKTRIPRYGRDLKYDKRSTEALIPSVGVNEDGNGEVFRLNLEIGRFMKGYEVDVGADDSITAGTGGMQGGIGTGSVNTAAIAEDSHNLLAFGTSLGTVEFWDPRSRSRVGLLSSPAILPSLAGDFDQRDEITALEFHPSGLTLATGSASGLVHLYDLRSPVPLLKKDQGYGYPIQNLIFLHPSSTTSHSAALLDHPKILSADKRIIKVWNERDGAPWTSVEPAVDLNHVEWCKDSGMLLTANEGRQQHAFLIPQLGPSPKWCSFLDNIVEEMAEDAEDANALGAGHKAGEIYDNFKFLTMKELKALNIDHLVGTTSLLRPYMHGYFVNQELYEEARLISNPDMWEQQRAKSIQEKIDKERESRIRGSKKEVKVRINRRLAERIAEREEKNERRKAKRILERGGDEEVVEGVKAPMDATIGSPSAEDAGIKSGKERDTVLTDPRFAKMFQDEEFEIDETSREFTSINPSTTSRSRDRQRGLTAVEEEELEDQRRSSDSEASSDIESDEDTRTTARKNRSVDPDAGRISTVSYKKSGHKPQQPRMLVSSSAVSKKPRQDRDRSFGARASTFRNGDTRLSNGRTPSGGVVGEREITFTSATRKKKQVAFDRNADEQLTGRKVGRGKERRSASGNTFRRM